MTEAEITELIDRGYAAFNARDIDGALAGMRPDVEWANGWEGGHVHGHDEVRAYWTRQCNELDPTVTPVAIAVDGDIVDVTVAQVVRPPATRCATDASPASTFSPLIDRRRVAAHRRSRS